MYIYIYIVGIYPIHNLFYLCPAMHDPLECKRDLSHGMMLWLKPVSLRIVGAEQFYPTAVKEPCQHLMLLEDLLLDEWLGEYRVIMESIW